VREDLHLTGGQLGVDRTGGPAPHLSADAQDELVAHALGDAERLRSIRVAYHLRQSLAVAQVDEDHAAMVAAPVCPSAQGDSAIDERGAQLSAIVAAHYF
jgi:hypothetical protein